MCVAAAGRHASIIWIAACFDRSTPMIAFGERLRRAREEAGVSLTEISARTKIRVSVLEAIERADLARLPAAFYTKAFLRAYAAQVHLEAEPIVEEYLAVTEIPPASSATRAPSATRRRPRTRPKGPG